MAERHSGRVYFTLVRHFFNQFLQNETIAFQDQQRDKIVTSLILVSFCGALIPFVRLFPRFLLESDSARTWVEKCLFIAIIMLVMAILSVLEWDSFFLSRQDFLNLGYLPVPGILVLAAKLTAILAFVTIFCLGAAVLSGFVYTVMLTHKLGSLLFSSRYFLIHLLVLFLSSLFVFFLCAFIQSVFLCLLPPSVFRRISAYIQSGWVLLILVLFVRINDIFFLYPGWLENSDPRAVYSPFLWFTALYEIGIGRSTPFYQKLAGTGLTVLVILMLSYFLVAMIGYRRHFFREGEAGERVRRAGVFQSIWDSVFHRHPHSRGLHLFVKTTVKRSQMHRRQIGAFLAVGSGAAILIFLFLKQAPGDAFMSIYGFAPLHLLFWSALLAVRSAVVLPVAGEANWIFRLMADESPSFYRGVSMKIVWLRFFLPVCGIGILCYGFLWNWGLAIKHTLFALSLASLILACAFWRFRKIPFTCEYMPGKANLKALVVPYLLGFAAVMYLVIFFESRLIFFAWRWLIAVLVLGGLAGLMVWKSRRISQEELKFFEESDPAMLSLGFDSF